MSAETESSNTTSPLIETLRNYITWKEWTPARTVDRVRPPLGGTWGSIYSECRIAVAGVLILNIFVSVRQESLVTLKWVLIILTQVVT